MTLDGKVAGPGPQYWPIGSEVDLAALLDLRASCDVLVHGRKTALGYAHLDRLSTPEFGALLASNAHTKPYAYMVCSAHPDELLLEHIAPRGRMVRVVLATTESAKLPKVLPQGVEVWRVGGEAIDLVALKLKLGESGLKRVALEAGPQLFGAFVKAKLVDELHLTLAPKLFGTAFGTPTMIGGILFAPAEVPALKLIEMKSVANEIFAKYRFLEVRP